MAPLTWRNVAAPDFTPAAQILSNAGQSLDNGFSGIGGVFQGIRDGQIDKRSNEALGRLAQVKGPGDVDAALAAVLSSTAPGDRNNELNSAIANLRGTAFGYDAKRASINSVRSSTANVNAAAGRVQTTFDRGILRQDQEAEFARSYANLAGQPSSFSAHIARNESGGAADQYDTLFGHRNRGNGVKVSNMTIKEASDFASPSGSYATSVKGEIGRVATPMGKFQIVGTTLRKLQDNLGLPDDVPFSPAVQEQLGLYLAQQRVNGPRSMEAAREGLRNEWEGFKNLSNAELDDIINETRSQAPVTRETVLAAASGGQAPSNAPQSTEGSPTALQAVSVGDLLPDNSLLTFDQVTGFIDRREQDVAKEKSEADIQIRESIKTDVFDMIKGLGTNALSEGKDLILNSDLPAKQKEIYLQELSKVVSENQEYFQVGEKGSGPSLINEEDQSTVDELLGQITDNESVSQVFDPASTNLARVEGTVGEDGQVTGGSAGGTDMATQLAALSKQFTDEDGNSQIDIRETAGLVQQLATQTGLPVEMIMGAVPNAINKGGWFKDNVDVNYQNLLRELQPYIGADGRADPQAVRRVKQQGRERERITQQATNIRQKLAKLDQDFSVIARREDTPQNREKVRQMQAQKNDLISQLQGLVIQSNLTNEVPERGEPVADGGQGPDSLIQASTNLLRSRPDSLNTTRPSLPDQVETPRGRVVDPEASQFDQIKNRVLGEAEISSELSRIQVLLGGQSSPAAKLLGGAADFFRPSAVAKANAASRQKKSEALKWYQSVEAKQMFLSRPDLLEIAKEDPISFFGKRIGQTVGR